MTPSAIAAEMRADLRHYRRRMRLGGPEECLQAKDDFCERLERKLSDLVRAIGTPDRLTMAPGPRVLGRRTIQVVTRHRVSARG